MSADHRITDEQRREFKMNGCWNFGFPVTVRWRETDQLGHVNHLAYLTYCEDVRNVYSGAVGLPLPSKETTSYLILSLRAEYKQAAFFNDVLMVTTRTLRIGRTSAVFDYAVWKEGCIFTAEMVVVLYDPAAGRKIPWPEAVKEQVRLLDPGVVLD